jgi:hypothetical protein
VRGKRGDIDGRISTPKNRTPFELYLGLALPESETAL